MKKWRVRLNIDGRQIETVVQANSYWEAERLIKAQYPKATIQSIYEER